jgi:putative aldouronate transport system substrate-binding protein
MFKKWLNVKFKTIGALWIVLMLGLSLLGACGDNTATPAASPAVGAANTPAATGANSAANLPPVELTLTWRAVPQPDTQLVQDELNKVLKAKINATVKLNPIDPASYEQKIKLAFAANEKMDLLFTASWTNNLWTYIAQGNLLPLDDLLAKQAPKLFASMPASVWNGLRVNGKIYAVPNQSLFVQPWGAQIRKDLAEKYKLDLNSLTKYEDLEPFLKAVKEGEGITPIYSDDQTGGFIFRPTNYKFDAIVDLAGVVVKTDDPELKVFNEYATPEFRQAVELARKWYQAGYYTKDPLPTADAVSAMINGKYALVLHQTGPDVPASNKARFNRDFVVKSFSPQVYLTTTGIASNLLAISRTSTNPQRAMMLLELLNNDVETFNLLAKGVEGKHWTWVDKDKKLIGLPSGVTPQTSGYNPNTDWAFGNVFNGYYITPDQVGVWQKDAQLNKAAPASQALGFAADLTKLNTEAAQVNTVIKQYAYPLMKGQMDPTGGIAEFLNKLKAAGQDKIIEEVQSQILTWKKTK